MTSPLGDRMRRARLAGGLTLEEVRGRIGRPITKAGLSKYELGKSAPDADFLLRFARVCEVPPSYFLSEAPTKVEWLAYRRHFGLGKRALDRIRAFAEERAEAWTRLRDALHPSEKPDVPRPVAVRTVEDAERAATRLRKAWGLGDGPIESLAGILERRGWILVGWPERDGFDALCGRAGATPLVVLNVGAPGDVRRFTLAHEVGHFLLRSVGGDGTEEEARIDRFAAALLAPEAAVRRELGNRRTHIEYGELAALKREYGLRMRTWLRRALDLGIVPAAEHRRWMAESRRRGWDLVEPVVDRREERPSRLGRMALRGFAERLVDRDWVRRICPEAVESGLLPPEAEEESSAERLLRLPPEDRAPALAEAAERAREAYRNDPELTEFASLDDEDPWDE